MKHKDNLPVVVYWITTTLIGTIFMLLGFQHLLSSNDKITDLLSVWSFVLAIGFFAETFFSLGAKCTEFFRAKKTPENTNGWTLTLNIAWMFISALLSDVIVEVIWKLKECGDAVINTNGFSIMAMGLTIVTMYYSYYRQLSNGKT